MKQVTVRFSLFAFAFFIVIALLVLFGLIIDYRHFLVSGSFKKGTETFLGLLGIFIGVLFIIFKVLPSYRIIFSKEGIMREYTVRLGGLTIYNDKYGQARWEDVNSLDIFNIGWLWGLALNFTVDHKHRMVLLNFFFAPQKEAVQIILENIPSDNISEKAKIKIARLGVNIMGQ
jgi:hypothetical protein